MKGTDVANSLGEDWIKHEVNTLGHKMLGVSLPIFDNSGPSLVKCRERPLHPTQVELRIIHWWWKNVPEGLYSWNLSP